MFFIMIAFIMTIFILLFYLIIALFDLISGVMGGNINSINKSNKA